MQEPRRIWWARPRKLCALERPGGGGRSHRPDRRRREIAWLAARGVRTIVSTMPSRHNLAAYEEAGLRALHVPVRDEDAPERALAEVLGVLRRELRRPGAVAVHGDHRTDFVAAACAACLRDVYGVPIEDALDRAALAGLAPSAEAAALASARGRRVTASR